MMRRVWGLRIIMNRKDVDLATTLSLVHHLVLPVGSTKRHASHVSIKLPLS